VSTNTPMWVETLSSLASQSQSEQTEQKVPANFIRATQQSFAFAATQVLTLPISNYKKNLWIVRSNFIKFTNENNVQRSTILMCKILHKI